MLMSFSQNYVSISVCEPLRFLLSRIIIVIVVVVFSPFCLPFLRKTDDDSEQGTSAASIMEERMRDTTSTRAKEEHVKEFEDLSKTTTMKATLVVNVVLVSREYPMSTLRLQLVYLSICYYCHVFHRYIYKLFKICLYVLINIFYYLINL